MASTVSPTTLQAAGEKKAPPDELCKAFKAFLAAEGKMVKGLQENSATCGVPSEVLKQVKEGHGKATEVGKKVCDAAAQEPRPAAPSLADALGATPTVPDASVASKKGASTFDTLPSEFSADLSTRPSRDAIIQRPSLGKRASRGLARFLIIFSIGIGATLAWQSYGDAARAMLANSSPLLGWLAPQTAPLAQTTPSMMVPPAADTASSDLQQLTAALASMRQSVDELAAQLAVGQQQVADNVAKLHADEQKILQKLSATPQRLSATPPGATAAPARKPAPVTAPPSPSASPSPSAQAR
jgi:hypothetical protein